MTNILFTQSPRPSFSVPGRHSPKGGAPLRTMATAALLIGLYSLTGCASSSLAANRSNPARHSESKVRSIPEYNRTMKKVLLCLDAGASSTDVHREILAHLPSYTEILLLLPRGRVEPATLELMASPRHEGIRFIPFDGQPADHGILHFINQAGAHLIKENIAGPIPLQFGTIWSQDLFEPVALSGEGLRLIAAPVHLCLWSESLRSLSEPVSDNRYLSALSPQGLEVKIIPAVFKGGNILIARKGTVSFAFCGSDILVETRQVRTSFPSLVTADSLLTGVIAGAMGADRVVFIGGNRPQPRRMYHLDQAMMPLSDGVVAVTRITGEIPADSKAKAALDEAAIFLEALRKTLKNLGFAVVDMDTPARSVLRSNFFVNAIPFTHAVTGRRTLLLPTFDGPGEAEAFRANTQRLAALGYTVVPVPCRTGMLKGGIHCLINVLE